MKRLTLAVVVIAGIATSATVALAGPKAGTGINGSLHDLNSDTFKTNFAHDKFERSCVFCHTPHNALAANTDNLSPLWNHADNGLNLKGKPYLWVAPLNLQTGKPITIASDPLIGPSRLCMACHDGSTAVDAHGSAGSDSNGTKQMTATYTDALGNTANRFITDLTVTHPIGFKYSDAWTARGAKELVPSSSGFIAGDIVASSWDTNTRGTLALSTKRIQDTLYGSDGYMTCASCHDVHNTLNVSDSTNSYNYFLYAKEQGSAICLSCHVK
jgi:hypothetical protein